MLKASAIICLLVASNCVFGQSGSGEGSGADSSSSSSASSGVNIVNSSEGSMTGESMMDGSASGGSMMGGGESGVSMMGGYGDMGYGKPGSSGSGKPGYGGMGYGKPEASGSGMQGYGGGLGAGYGGYDEDDMCCPVKYVRGGR